MKDNIEGGSRDTGSARQVPAQSALPASSDPRTQARSVSTEAREDATQDGDARPVSADMQQFIGRQLRAVFDDVAKQPIPDRFLELMKQLDNKTGVR